MHILSPVPTGSGVIVLHKALEKGIPGYRVRQYSPWWTLFPPTLSLMSRAHADLIHTTPDYAIFTAPRNRPLIVTFHNYVLDGFMRKYSSFIQQLHYKTDLRLFTRMALSRAQVLTAVSQFTAALVKDDLGVDKPIRVIPNGVDTIFFSPAKPKGFRKKIRVLFSGNLSKRKGADLLPHIARRLPSTIEILCATARGGGLQSSAPGNIRLLGHVSYEKMPELYQDVDILLLPTVREGMSLAVLEAMASGLPVVATRCSSLPELIHHGKGGYLCGLGNVEEFVEAILRLAQSGGLRRRMGQYNRARVECDYTMARMLRAYRELFEEVLDTRTG